MDGDEGNIVICKLWIKRKKNLKNFWFNQFRGTQEAIVDIEWQKHIYNHATGVNLYQFLPIDEGTAIVISINCTDKIRWIIECIWCVAYFWILHSISGNQ